MIGADHDLDDTGRSGRRRQHESKRNGRTAKESSED
jgi:hypothetical protein